MVGSVRLCVVEQRMAVLVSPQGVAAYDFDFALNFACDHPRELPAGTPLLLRVGAADDYAALCATLAQDGLRPINPPEAHLLCSELEHWYPLIEQLTPRSRIYPSLPPADVIEAEFGWPVFIKGSRQTSKHDPSLAVVDSRERYASAAAAYARDPILHWQRPVVREFVRLQPVRGDVAGKIRPSLEFRTFWLHGECVGHGPYWYQVPRYECADIDDGLAIAQQAACRVNAPFLVVDIAKTVDGRWIVIECNDAQESGHAGIPPLRLWREVMERWRS